MEENFTILQLYDGNLYNTCGIYDASIVLVKNFMMPHDIAIFEDYMRSRYKAIGEKLKIQQVAIDYLTSLGLTVIPLPVMVIDYSGDKGE